MKKEQKKAVLFLKLWPTLNDAIRADAEAKGQSYTRWFEILVAEARPDLLSTANKNAE